MASHQHLDSVQEDTSSNNTETNSPTHHVLTLKTIDIDTVKFGTVKVHMQGKGFVFNLCCNLLYFL